MGGRLFERFEERVGGLLVGAVDLVDEEDAMGAAEGEKLRSFFEQDAFAGW